MTSIDITLHDKPGRTHPVVPDGCDYDAVLDMPSVAFGMDLIEPLFDLMEPEACTCETCGKGVGAVLAGDADEREEWVTPVLRFDTEGGGIISLCVPCATA